MTANLAWSRGHEKPSDRGSAQGEDVWGDLGLDFTAWLLETSPKEFSMSTLSPETDPVKLAERAKAVHDTDEIWALEGFEVTQVRKALSDEYAAGRISADEQLAVVLLDARLVGARDVLAALDADDPRREVIAARLKEQTQELKDMAQRISPALVKALGLS
jgi:hypothetical protein